MRTATYSTVDERRVLLKEANAQGESMIHDDFLPDGTKRLTFRMSPEPKSDPLIAQWSQAVTVEDKLSIIAQRLGLE